MNKIWEFKNEYKFLSNFFYASFNINGHIFPTVEHYYQANKSTNQDDFKYIVEAEKPNIAKQRGKEIKLRPDWEFIQDYIMLYGVKSKFYQNKNIRIKLLNTNDAILIEGNYWNDKYWGYCLKTNQGENKLGKILMCIRSILKGQY